MPAPVADVCVQGSWCLNSVCGDYHFDPKSGWLSSPGKHQARLAAPLRWMVWVVTDAVRNCSCFIAMTKKTTLTWESLFNQPHPTHMESLFKPTTISLVEQRGAQVGQFSCQRLQDKALDLEAEEVWKLRNYFHILSSEIMTEIQKEENTFVRSCRKKSLAVLVRYLLIIFRTLHWFAITSRDMFCK